MENNNDDSEVLEEQSVVTNDNKAEENSVVSDELDVPKKKKSFMTFLKDHRKLIIICIIAFIIILGVLFFIFRKDNAKDFSIVDIEQETQGSYISNDEKFVVKTENGSLEEVEKHLYIEPAVNYEIKKKSKNKYEVVTKDIPSNKIVNVKYLDNKVVENNWAFQSTKDLTVTSIYPADKTSDISRDTTIEITFSYPDVEDINKYVEIEPKIEGTFEQNGRTWILKPKKSLEEGQTYTITISEGIKNKDNKLTQGFKTTFSTDKEEDTDGFEYNSITLDGIETFRTTENPMFITTGDVSKVEMFKFNSNEDFRKYITHDNSYNLKSLGKVSFKKLNHDLYMVEKKYDSGYYLLKTYNNKGKLYFSIPIQINNLQAYLLTTENDLLVWAGSNNKVQKDVEVSYEKNSLKTDKDGIAVIKKYNDKNNKLKYVKVGKNNPLYIGVNNIDNEVYPSGYIYTDRPLYKNTDDINIFGYIPLKYFEDKNVNVDDFVLSIEDTKIPIKINKDGTFTTKYHLDNVKSNDMYISLTYKDNYIASRYIEVKEYEKEMYDFKIDMDKDYVYAGDKFKFKVKVTHISGVVVPNKEIQVIDGDKVIKAKTNEKGIAEFSIKTKRDKDSYTKSEWNYVTIKSTLTEASQEGYDVWFNVIHRLLDVSDEDFDMKDKKFTININSLSTNKKIKRMNSISDLVDKAYNGKTKIELEETKYTRTISGYEYNEITKENVPEYDYDSESNIVKTDNYTIKNGKVNYKVNYDFKKDTEDVTYSYDLIFTLRDSKNVETKYDFYLYDNDYTVNMDGYIRFDNNPVEDEYYNLYNYYMPMEEKVYSVNSQIIRNLYSYNGEREAGNNKFLLIKYKNNIIDTKIINNTDEIKTTFNDDDRAGIQITGAYLKDGNFYRLPTEYLDYNEKDSELKIDIKPSKNTYTPGEEVTVNLKVTNKDGKGVKSKLNVSVVDEGVFKSSSDTTNILEQLYQDLYYTQYTFSTYRDYNLYIDGGGAGSTTGGVRKDFGDTIFFKTVETDSNGNAKVKFKMNDSITSFRITAHATTSNVDAGSTYTNIESSIPLSISFNKPIGVKESDDVVLNALGIGTVNGDIEYEFSIKGIDNKITKKAKLSNQVYVNFGKLPAGTYTATISAKSGNESDKVKFDFNVVKTQTEISIKTTNNIQDQNTIKPTKNPIKLEFFRTSFETYQKYLDILEDTNQNRLDTKFTYSKALEFENKYNDKDYKIDLGNIRKFREDEGYKYLPGDEDISQELTAILTYYDSSFARKKSYYYSLIKSDDLNKKLDGYMNLAAQKEPILDDLNIIKDKVDKSNAEKLVLSYLFLGDYKSAKKYYNMISDSGIKAYAATFIDKKNAEKQIDSIYNAEKDNRYVYLAMISYFENNNVGLSSKEKVTVSYGKTKKIVNVSSLGKKYLTISQKDLKALKFKSRYKDINISYYYDGLLDEIGKDKKEQNIKMKLDKDNIKVGNTVHLNIDVKNVKNDTTIDLYLPYGLTLGNTFNSKFASIVASTKEHVSIYVGDKLGNTISIPLYASSSGNYTIEPIVIKNDNSYQLSNQVTINISE